MDRLYYLTEEQFTQISRLLPPEDSGRGRPPKIRNREALEGILAHPAHRDAVARFTAAVRGVAHHLHALAPVGGARRVVEYPDGAQAPEAD